MSQYSQPFNSEYIQKFSSPYSFKEPGNGPYLSPKQNHPSQFNLNNNSYIAKPLTNYQDKFPEDFKSVIQQNRDRANNYTSNYNSLKFQINQQPLPIKQHPVQINEHFLNSSNTYDMKSPLMPQEHYNNFYNKTDYIPPPRKNEILNSFPQTTLYNNSIDIAPPPIRKIEENFTKMSTPFVSHYQNLPPLSNEIKFESRPHEFDPTQFLSMKSKILPNQPLKTSFSQFSPPPYSTVNATPSFIPLREIPIMNENLQNIKSSPPPIFYSHKIQEQMKENKVFPDFITAFGTYKHYDLASRESKFRKTNKDHTTSKIENNFIDNMSYLNVNFLQQSHYDKIFDVLKNFMFFDRSIEKIKGELVHQNDFDLKLLFQIFDDNGSGQIVIAEWKEGFKRLGISAEENDIYLFINRYSRDGNKKISFEEFCEIVLPANGHNKEYLLKKEVRQKQFSYESQHLAAKLFKMLLNVSYSSELLRREIQEEKVNIKEVFNFMDYSKGGLISKEEIRLFLSKYNFHPFNEDLDNLMRTFDRNNSGKINFKEFEYELMPKLIDN